MCPLVADISEMAPGAQALPASPQGPPSQAPGAVPAPLGALARSAPRPLGQPPRCPLCWPPFDPTQTPWYRSHRSLV